MTITPEQRARRRNHIGSSDSPAIVGVDPWRNAYDVYLSKVLELEDFDNNEAIALGNAYERPLVEWAGEELGIEVERDVELVSQDNPVIAANLDGRGKGKAKRIGVEAKVTSLADQWGREGTDQVPDRVNVQTQQQMYVADLDEVYVPVLTAEYDRLTRKMYRVKRSEVVIGGVVAQDTEFWEQHVVPKIAPTHMAPSMDVVARVRRLDGKKATIDDLLVLAWQSARQRRLDSEKEEAQAKALLIAAMGDAEVGDFGDPEHLFTYLEQERKSTDAKALRRDYPEIAERLARTSTYRVSRIQKRPKE